MEAAVFVEPGRIVLEDKPIPDVGPLDALLRITTTTICGTDVHILKGEYPVRSGLTIGHEPVGVIEKLGSAVRGYREGQRVIAGAITPSGTSNASLCGRSAQCGGHERPHGWKPLGGWRFGNTIDGAQAEYLLVPDAEADLSPVPNGLTDEQVLMCPGHHVHRLKRRRIRWHPHRRHSRGVCARADWALCHCWCQVDGRDYHHWRRNGA
jgi:threonine dehydrogenase-like Zn-dependent dehydrogenase